MWLAGGSGVSSGSGAAMGQRANVKLDGIETRIFSSFYSQVGTRWELLRSFYIVSN